MPPDWNAIADTTRRGFTFHEMLDNISLVHMNGRIYDPLIGRFMSVDPLIGSLADSQSVNPYAYVGNRPLSFIDPSGFTHDDPDGGPDQPQCGIECNPDGGVASWDWYKDLFDDIGDALDGVDDFFEDLFGIGGPPPPPPATTLPGTSAQNGVNLCDGGLSSTGCTGTFGNGVEIGFAASVIAADFSVAAPDAVVGRGVQRCVTNLPCVVIVGGVVTVVIVSSPILVPGQLERPELSVEHREVVQGTGQASATDQATTPSGPGSGNDDDEGKGAKSKKERDKHLAKLKEARGQLRDLQGRLDRLKGPKSRDPVIDEMRDLQDQIKGHEKEIRQKWPELGNDF